MSIHPAQGSLDHGSKMGADEMLLHRRPSVSQEFWTHHAENKLRIQCCLFVWVMGPQVIFLAFFSAMGMGPRTYRVAAANAGYAYGLVCSSVVVLVLLWVLDMEHWKRNPAKSIKFTLLGAALVAFCVGVILLAGDYAYGPICVFMLTFPLWLFGFFWLSNFCQGSNHWTFRHFMTYISSPLFLAAALVFSCWLAWVFDRERNEWGMKTRQRLARRSDCEPVDDLDDEYAECLGAFMIWVAPLAISAATAFLGLIGYVLDEKEQHTAPKYIGSIMMLLLFGLWCAASLAGAGSGISSAMMAFVMGGFIMLGVMVVGAYGAKDWKKNQFVLDVQQKYASLIDWFQGLLVVTSGPVILLYFAVAWLNQCFRKCGMHLGPLQTCRPLEDDGEKTFHLTRTARKYWLYMTSWEWSSVLVKAHVWGIAFMALNVLVAKFTILFLSRLIEICEGIKQDAPSDAVGLAYVTLVIFLVGLFLFLLPPVPGVPIYLTAGIILIAAGTNNTDDATGGMGVGMSVLFTFVVCLVLKLFACSCQQLGFGGLMRQSVAVRQAVGVNTTTIRTMKLILQRPGLDLAKVSLLVGGPDWPTSVLCGIMGLPLLPVLCGTLPVALLILPTILAGTFIYLGALGGSWEWCNTAATIMAVGAAGVQTGSMIVAAYFLEKTVREEGDQLTEDKMPMDQEVLTADEKAQAVREAYAKVSAWRSLGREWKLVLAASTVLLSTSCYIMQFYSGSCFREFELVDSVREDLDGKWTNFVTTLGWVAIGMFGVSLTVAIVFCTVKSRQAQRAVRDSFSDVTTITVQQPNNQVLPDLPAVDQVSNDGL